MRIPLWANLWLTERLDQQPLRAEPPPLLVRPPRAQPLLQSLRAQRQCAPPERRRACAFREAFEARGDGAAARPARGTRHAASIGAAWGARAPPLPRGAVCRPCPSGASLHRVEKPRTVECGPLQSRPRPGKPSGPAFVSRPAGGTRSQGLAAAGAEPRSGHVPLACTRGPSAACSRTGPIKGVSCWARGGTAGSCTRGQGGGKSVCACTFSVAHPPRHHPPHAGRVPTVTTRLCRAAAHLDLLLQHLLHNLLLLDDEGAQNSVRQAPRGKDTAVCAAHRALVLLQARILLGSQPGDALDAFSGVRAARTLGLLLNILNLELSACKEGRGRQRARAGTCTA
jgi:hypothetical protein